MASTETELVPESAGKTTMWLRLLWQMRELLPLLGRMLPLLEGWVAGNSGASAATSRALAQLEARVGSTQEGVEGQLRNHGTVLLHLSNELKALRLLAEADRTDREEEARQLREEIARLRRFALLAMVAAVIAAGVGVIALVLLLQARAHSGR